MQLSAELQQDTEDILSKVTTYLNLQKFHSVIISPIFNLIYEPLSFLKFYNMLLLVTKWRSISILMIFIFNIQELWLLKIEKCCFQLIGFTDDKMEVKFNIDYFHFHCSGVMVLVILKNDRTQINVIKFSLLSHCQPLFIKYTAVVYHPCL